MGLIRLVHVRGHKAGFVVVFLAVLLVSFFASISLSVSAAGDVGDADWSMFRHDPPHTGTSPSTGPNTNNTMWSYTTGDIVTSCPAVADGKVYVGSDDNNVYCLSAESGAFVWSYTTGSVVRSSPAVVDGKVYVGSGDSKVYCLEAATGALIWS
ncbi:MAG: PQQ-binding-like beta-propeller repeat protein, partial [Candidatus Bathyarchaeia archaeon]|nr:PQQ-binding-like beta-propeller repeat protein [Candidatus Bathyarchaeia archaeon]